MKFPTVDRRRKKNQIRSVHGVDRIYAVRELDLLNSILRDHGLMWPILNPTRYTRLLDFSSSLSLSLSLSPCECF